MTSSAAAEGKTLLRCAFCLAVNRVDVSRAVNRPKCGSCEKPMLLDRPVRVTDEDFERTVLGADVPVLVDFYADWCQPCKVLAPMLDEVANKNVGRFLVAKIDTDAAPKTAQAYAIGSIPTVILFSGGAEVSRMVGIMPDELRAMVTQANGSAETVPEMGPLT